MNEKDMKLARHGDTEPSTVPGSGNFAWTRQAREHPVVTSAARDTLETMTRDGNVTGTAALVSGGETPP